MEEKFVILLKAVKNVSYLSNVTFNLFSLTQMTAKWWIMGGHNESIWIKKGYNKVVFNMMIPTPKGMWFAMYFAHDTEVTGSIAENHITTNIQQAHKRLGHANEDATRKTVILFSWKPLRGSTLKPCKVCAAAKAKQKNVPKTSSMAPSNTTKEESRIYLNISDYQTTRQERRLQEELAHHGWRKKRH